MTLGFLGADLDITFVAVITHSERWCSHRCRRSPLVGVVTEKLITSYSALANLIFLGHYSEQGLSTVYMEKLPAKDAMAPIVLSFEVGKDINTSLLTLTRLDLRGVGSLLAVRSSSRSTGVRMVR